MNRHLIITRTRGGVDYLARCSGMQASSTCSERSAVERLAMKLCGVKDYLNALFAGTGIQLTQVKPSTITTPGSWIAER
jgi:hypothetical protein